MEEIEFLQIYKIDDNLIEVWAMNKKGMTIFKQKMKVNSKVREHTNYQKIEDEKI